MAYKNRLSLSVPDLKAWIARHYGLDVIVGKLRAGYMSTVVWLNTQTQAFVFKIYGETDYERMIYGLKITDYLRQCGLPVSDCMPSQEGDVFVDFFGQKAALWSCLPGEVFVVGDREGLRAAGKMLGTFHRMTRSLAGEGFSKLTVERLVEELETTWDLVTDEDGHKLAERLRKCLTEILPGVDRGLPEAVLHCDYRAQNLLFADGDVSGILDLDGCCAGPRIFDVVYALAFFQAVVAERPLSEPEMLVFFKAYHGENALTDTELDGLGDWLGLALLKGMTLWLHIAYIEGVSAKAQVWIAAYDDFFAEHKQIAKRLVEAL